MELNYFVIGVIILALGCLHVIAIRQHAKKVKDETWLYVAAFAMLLEVQARAARDRQAAKDRQHKVVDTEGKS